MKRRIRIGVSDEESVTGIIEIPKDAWCLMVLAHGAGANMEHAFMEGVVRRLAANGVGSLRFNFLYMENGGGRPDPPRIAHKVITAAVERVQEYASARNLSIAGGGKSFGGRMFSEVMARPGISTPSALVFYGFPLHAPGKPGTDRAVHLAQVKVPMLFLQGSRDTLARPDLIARVVKGLGRGTLVNFEDADHSFHVPKRSGKSDEQVLDEMTRHTVIWLRKQLT